MTTQRSGESRQLQPRAEYVARINRVIDYINTHLGEELELTTLAKVANFSPYHFHRIFSGLVGETLAHYIARLRAERAATRIKQKPHQSLTEIALDCGYSSSAAFSRAFKSAFGMTPTEWRESDRKLSQTSSKYGEAFGNLGKAEIACVAHLGVGTSSLTWSLTMNTESGPLLEANVDVRALPAMEVAYVRHVGPYAGDNALFERLFSKIMSWAGPRGLLGPSSRILALYHDDPSVTEESKLRTDCAVAVPADTKVEGEIGKETVPAGQYAVGHFEIAMDQFPLAWQSMMGGWLPESGYQPADGPCFELYLNNPQEHPDGKCIMEIHIPVKPL